VLDADEPVRRGVQRERAAAARLDRLDPRPVAGGRRVVGIRALDKVVTLSNGRIDFPALNEVMDGVVLGTAVSPEAWRAMRRALSAAIALENKSHPAHESNFNQNQPPEQQIKDWAKPIKGPLRETLEA
jgi:hypothetical protein